MYGPLQLHSLRLCWYLFINQCFMIDHPFLQALSISWFSNILPIIGDSYTLIFFAPAMSPAWCQHWRQSNRIIVSCRQGPHLGWKTPMHFSLLRSLAFSSFVLEICPTIVNCTQPLKKKRQLLVSAWSIIQLTNPKTAFGIVIPIQLNHWK